MDWDNAYRQRTGFEGPPRWNIGEPQPERAMMPAYLLVAHKAG
jgi:hypothetical protein